MSVPTATWERLYFVYVDDFSREFFIQLNDYIGKAGGLVQYTGDTPNLGWMSGSTHPRHVRIRSMQPESNGKKHYKDIPVLKTSELWTGRLGQMIIIGDQEFETIKKVDEKEYGRKGAAEERRRIKRQNHSGAKRHLLKHKSCYQTKDDSAK